MKHKKKHKSRFPEKDRCKKCKHRHNPGNPWCQTGCSCSVEFQAGRLNTKEMLKKQQKKERDR